MNPRATHFIQGGLAIIAGTALAVAQAYPQDATLGHLIAAVAGIALANLGVFSGSITDPKVTDAKVVTPT